MSALVASHVPELELFDVKTDSKRQRHLTVTNSKFDGPKERKEMEETESESSDFEPERDNDMSQRTEEKTLGAGKKRVNFHDSVKTWDGLRRFHCDFDELLFCFLVKGQSVGDGDVLQWTGEDCHRIYHMTRLMSDLIARVRCEDPENKGECPVPCLPQGGGRAIRVERAYEPYLLSLLSVLVTALSSAVQSPRRRNFELVSCSRHQNRLKHFVENKSDIEALVLLEEEY